jgi:hypothetical protein
MPLARTWLWMTLIILSLLILVCVSLILIASALLPLDLRLANGFSAYSYNGQRNREVQVVHTARPGNLVRTIVLQQEMLFFQEMLCMSVDEAILWEPGNNADTLSRHLRSDANVLLYVNGVRMTIADGRLTAQDTGAMHYSFFDSPEQLVGTMPDVEYCLNTADLQAGIHAVAMRITSLSGVAHRYDWFFLVVEAPSDLQN